MPGNGQSAAASQDLRGHRPPSCRVTRHEGETPRRYRVEPMPELTRTEAIDLVGRYRSRPGDPREDARRRAPLGRTPRAGAPRERVPRPLRRRGAPARRDDPGVHRRDARGLRARGRDRRLLHGGACRRGRPRVHRVLPPDEPHRGAPARARPPRTRRPSREGERRGLGRRRVREARDRGRRRHGAAAPAGTPVPPRLHGTPHRGSAQCRLAQHPSPDEPARRARHRRSATAPTSAAPSAA